MTSTSASSTMADALRLERVRAGYGQTVVLEDVDLILRERDALAVLGRNGVGKTTLLATIMGHTARLPAQPLLSEKALPPVPLDHGEMDLEERSISPEWKVVWP